MSLSNCTCGTQWKEQIYAILRVVTGAVFLYHGWGKVVMGTAGVTGFFSSVGIPMASTMAFLVTWIEVIGGIALIVGLYTHWVAKLNILVMIGAIWFVHLKNGYNVTDGGIEYPLMILVVNLYILASGARAYSLDARRKNSGVQQ